VDIRRFLSFLDFASPVLREKLEKVEGSLHRKESQNKLRRSGRRITKRRQKQCSSSPQ